MVSSFLVGGWGWGGVLRHTHTHTHTRTRPGCKSGIPRTGASYNIYMRSCVCMCVCARARGRSRARILKQQTKNIYIKMTVFGGTNQHLVTGTCVFALSALTALKAEGNKLPRRAKLSGWGRVVCPDTWGVPHLAGRSRKRTLGGGA